MSDMFDWVYRNNLDYKDGRVNRGYRDVIEKKKKHAGLSIKKKYADFKQEILHYGQFSIKQYKPLISKTNAYYQSMVAKSMISKRGNETYGISRKERISRQHLTSIILYTDYTALSSEFTASFRKCGPFEPFQAVINRNRKFWWMSKLLKEAVSEYGQDDSSDAHPLGKLCGPLYCGMNFIMKMRHFVMPLFSPTSTTVQIEVAMKFSGASGIIIELDNRDASSMINWFAESMKGLDVSRISRFKEEEER